MTLVFWGVVISTFIIAFLLSLNAAESYKRRDWANFIVYTGLILVLVLAFPEVFKLIFGV